MLVEKSLFINQVLFLYNSFKKALRKDDYFVLWTSLLFYFLLYFNINNKTLLGLFLLFLYIFYKRLKNFRVALFFLYLLFLPFTKGKAFPFVLISSSKTSFGIPYTYDFVVTFADVVFIGLFAMILRAEIVEKEKFKSLRFNKSSIFLFAFLISVFISIFNSSFGLVSYMAYLKLTRFVLVYFVIQKYIKKARIRQLFPLVLASSLIFESGWSGFQFLLKRPLGRAIEHLSGRFSTYGHTAIEEVGFFRVQGTFDHPNTLGVFLLVFLAFILVQLVNSRLSRTKRRIYITAFIAGLFSLLLSASRASWGVFIGVLGLEAIFFKRKRLLPSFQSLKRLLLIIIVFGTVLVPTVVLPRLEHLYITLAEEGGFSYRVLLTEKAWQLLRVSPFGVGLVNFPVLLVKQFNFNSWPAPVHNLFMEIFVEAGIFSLVFFALFIIYSFRDYFLDIKVVKGDRFFLKTGAFFVTIAFLGIFNFYPFLWSSSIFEYFWLFLGLMLY